MRFATSLLMSLVFLGGAGVHGQQEYKYSFFALPTLGGSHSIGFGISAEGIAVGSAFLEGNGSFHATIWPNGEPIDLGTFGGSLSRAVDANTSGWVTGWALPPGGGAFDTRAFLWRNGMMEDIGSLGGERAEAKAINEAGEIVGWAEFEPANRANRAFHWADGQMIDLGDLEGRGSEAWALNNSGLIVGQSWRDGQGWRAVMWENGQIIDLGTLRSDNGGQSFALDVNDFGHIVGSADRDGSSNRSPFLWFEGRMYRITLPQGMKGGLAYGINNHAQIVGRGTTNGVRNKAFLWEQGEGARALDDLLPPRTRWRAEIAWDINDAGQIGGTGYPASDPEISVAFLMSPVYPTMEMLAPSPGTAGVPNTLTITNATPGARVTFLYSRFGGGERIPGCDLQQNALQLDSPTVIGTAIADQSGVASITRTVPPIARGQTILFQAVVQNECAISQLVVHRFE